MCDVAVFTTTFAWTKHISLVFTLNLFPSARWELYLLNKSQFSHYRQTKIQKSDNMIYICTFPCMYAINGYNQCTNIHYVFSNTPTIRHTVVCGDLSSRTVWGGRSKWKNGGRHNAMPIEVAYMPDMPACVQIMPIYTASSFTNSGSWAKFQLELQWEIQLPSFRNLE